MGKNIGELLIKKSKYVYIMGMVYACVVLLNDWILVMRSAKANPAAASVQLIPYLVKFGVIIVGAYILGLIVCGFGCIVRDNHKKAQELAELNYILANKLDEDAEDEDIYDSSEE